MNRCSTLARTLVAGLLLTSAHGQAPDPARKNAQADSVKRQWTNVAYASVSPAQVLDVYLPDEGPGPFPVILNVHGGAWRSGDKRDRQLTDVLEARRRGYAVVTMNYRLSQEAKFPAQIHDVKAAIRWVRANARTYHLNGAKLAVWGSSAGGHLVSLAGTSGGVKELEDLSLGNPTQSSRVQAVVDWFGPTNFLKMDEQLIQTGVNPKAAHNGPTSAESQLLGKTITEVPELVRIANPETYISRDDPPFFIQQGTVDGIVSREQSVEFAAQLEKVLGPKKVTLTLLEGAGHGGKQFSDPANLSRVLDFLDRWLN
jgi:acetyl esterase/lipase